MAIPSHYIQELVARNDIHDVISRHVQLKRNGRIYKGLCPFHGERSPSFTVYPETQSYYCFGCGAGGNVINFIKEINGLTYIEAVRSLAQASGMPLPDEDDGAAKQKSRIFEMNKLAARFFHQNLNSSQGANARKYLRQRQLSDKTIVSFGLGYASDSWSQLSDYLKSKGFKEQEIVTAYLAAKSSKGNIFDVFRNRIIFPIMDLRGNVIAFGGRRLGEDGPKYLNSGDTPVFRKSNGLFALNLAKKSGKDAFILAEGYMDVIALHQAGFPQAIATLGTALTTQQAKLIADYAKKVIIAYDSDEAGQKATKRAIDIFSKEEVPVQILQMSGAKDPDEFIKNFGAQRFEMLLEGADSALDFELMKLNKQFDIATVQGRIDYLTKACELLAKLKSPIQQDIYFSKLASQTGADKASIQKQTQQAVQKNIKRQTYEKNKHLLKEGVAQTIKVDYKQQGNTLPKIFAQQQIICALLRDNQIYPLVSSRLSPDKFTDGEMREAFTVFALLYKQNQMVDYTLLSHNVSESVNRILAQIIARNADIIISIQDVQMHINNLETAKLQQNEVREKSADELAARIKSLKEKKM